MAFEISICAKEGCESLSIIDETGFFGPDKPFGYNAPDVSVPTLTTGGVFGYTTYQAEIYYAIEGGFDDTAAPDYTVDLLTWAHTTDAVTGEVTWVFTLEDLNLTALRSGWWKVVVTALYTNNTVDYNYDAYEVLGLTQDLTSIMDTAMKKYYAQHGASGCDCDCGGEDLATLYEKYRIWKDFMGCAGLDDAFQTDADYLLAHLPLCSC